MSAKRAKSVNMSRSPRFWWTAGVLAVVAGILIAILQFGPDRLSSVMGQVGIEDPVRFEVDSAGCGYSDVLQTGGEAVVPERGQFCLLRLELRNLEEVPHQIEPSCLFMVDDAGALHPPRLDSAELLGLADLEESLGPFEFRRQSSLYYDVPKNAEMVAVELHESCASEGVRIDVPA